MISSLQKSRNKNKNHINVFRNSTNFSDSITTSNLNYITSSQNPQNPQNVRTNSNFAESKRSFKIDLTKMRKKVNDSLSQPQGHFETFNNTPQNIHVERDSITFKDNDHVRITREEQKELKKDLDKEKERKRTIEMEKREGRREMEEVKEVKAKTRRAYVDQYADE